MEGGVQTMAAQQSNLTAVMLSGEGDPQGTSGLLLTSRNFTSSDKILYHLLCASELFSSHVKAGRRHQRYLVVQSVAGLALLRQTHALVRKIRFIQC